LEVLVPRVLIFKFTHYIVSFSVSRPIIFLPYFVSPCSCRDSGARGRGRFIKSPQPPSFHARHYTELHYVCFRYSYGNCLLWRILDSRTADKSRCNWGDRFRVESAVVKRLCGTVDELQQLGDWPTG